MIDHTVFGSEPANRREPIPGADRHGMDFTSAYIAVDKVHRFVIFERSTSFWVIEVYDRATGAPCQVLRDALEAKWGCGPRDFRFKTKRDAVRYAQRYANQGGSLWVGHFVTDHFMGICTPPGQRGGRHEDATRPIRPQGGARRSWSRSHIRSGGASSGT
jgi:hypothetical protein